MNEETLSESQSVANSVVFLVIIAVVVVMLILVKRGRRDPITPTLPKGQRARPIALEWLDPILEIVVVAVILWNELASGWTHWVAGAIGFVIGIPIGLARARVMFVGAIPERRIVIMKRSAIEYSLLALLLLINILADYFQLDPSSGFSLLLTLLIMIAIGEAVIRSIAMTVKFRRWSGPLPTQDPESTESPQPLS